ncbi:HAMP domain-containing sensor histidine kinase [Lachnospiraceae bacterium 45-W7]
MKDDKHITSVILKRFFRKMLFAGLICMAALLACLSLGKAFFGSFVWYGNEGAYPLLHWISENQGIFVGGLFLTGLFLVGIFYWIRLLNYFQEVVNAMEKLAGEEPIRLRAELREVEEHMNEVQFQIRRNEQLAREAEQRKNDLVVYLAHDLKTPLTSVIGYLTLLREEKQISSELREKYLSVSLEKAERLEELINEFFEITRFNLTDLELETVTVSLKRMLEQIVYEFQPVLAEKRMTCSLELETEELKITCDTNKMQRVFDNLLRNALLYGYEGSVIICRAKARSENLCIQVENRGATIPEEKLNRIFEQFYRLDSARQSKTGGAGLGLAIAREIVERHGGRIQAESREEKTIFTVEIPAKQ